MRRVYLSVLIATAVAGGTLVSGQTPAAELRVTTPGVIYNGGLTDLAASYMKDAGVKVAITTVGMGKIVDHVKTTNPPPDVIFLPHELMSTLSLDNGIKPGSFTPIGKSEMGLAVRAGAPHPDISMSKSSLPCSKARKP